MRVEGSNGSVEYFEDRIVIRRKGLANVLTQGVQGDKTVPISRITAVQFRSAGSMMAGLIQFTIQGGREFRGGMMEATKDENAVLFTRDQEVRFAHLRDLVEAAVIAGTHPPSVLRSDVDDLSKLAALYEKGFLTKDEFDDRKRMILYPTVTSSGETIRQRAHAEEAAQAAGSTKPVQDASGKKRSIPWWGWGLIVLGVLMFFSYLSQP